MQYFHDICWGREQWQAACPKAWHIEFTNASQDKFNLFELTGNVSRQPQITLFAWDWLIFDVHSFGLSTVK
ncbi:MAG: hypothetical protein KAF91_18540 [Nostoc sp. TH1S01]|nr:hypothetical protein [Nostoc sp. TH1S01]